MAYYEIDPHDKYSSRELMNREKNISSLIGELNFAKAAEVYKMSRDQCVKAVRDAAERRISKAAAEAIEVAAAGGASAGAAAGV